MLALQFALDDAIVGLGPSSESDRSIVGAGGLRRRVDRQPLLGRANRGVTRDALGLELVEDVEQPGQLGAGLIQRLGGVD